MYQPNVNELSALERSFSVGNVEMREVFLTLSTGRGDSGGSTGRRRAAGIGLEGEQEQSSQHEQGGAGYQQGRVARCGLGVVEQVHPRPQKFGQGRAADG